MTQSNAPQSFDPNLYPGAQMPMQYWQPINLPHSGVGIASFVLAIFGGLVLLASFVLVGVLVTQNPGGMPRNTPSLALVGFGVLGGLLLHIIGLVLGIVVLLQRDRRKLFGILGLIFNGLLCLGVASILVIGTLRR